ncbi:MAG TPA: hypothetical protein VLN47_09585 [Clostridiaceae bacterium]|nr:hypothetical protein [Clostridiaceae bacterium]
MKNLVSKTLLLITLLQAILLYLIFTDRLADLKGYLPEVLCLGTAFLSLIFSFLYFKGSQPVRIPARTLSEIVLLAWLTFPVMIFQKGIFLLLMGIAICYRHMQRYPKGRFAIVPVFSMVTGMWSIGMYLFASFVTSM